MSLARARTSARALHRCISNVFGIQNFHPIIFECIDEALCRINFNLSTRKVIFRTEKSSQEKNISVKFSPPQVTYPDVSFQKLAVMILRLANSTQQSTRPEQLFT